MPPQTHVKAQILTLVVRAEPGVSSRGRPSVAGPPTILRGEVLDGRPPWQGPAIF
jgi:hypothetical protein